MLKVPDAVIGPALSSRRNAVRVLIATLNLGDWRDCTPSLGRISLNRIAELAGSRPEEAYRCLQVLHNEGFLLVGLRTGKDTTAYSLGRRLLGEQTWGTRVEDIPTTSIPSHVFEDSGSWPRPICFAVLLAIAKLAKEGSPLVTLNRLAEVAGLGGKGARARLAVEFLMGEGLVRRSPTELPALGQRQLATYWPVWWGEK